MSLANGGHHQASEETIGRPLLCFTSSIVQTETLQNLYFNRDERFQLNLYGCTIEKHTDSAGAVFFTTVAWNTGGTMGILKKIKKVVDPIFTGRILVFDHHVRDDQIRTTDFQTTGRVLVVRTVNDIVDFLGVSLEPEQRVCLKKTLFERRQTARERARAREHSTRDEQRQAFADQFTESFLNGTYLDPPARNHPAWDVSSSTIVFLTPITSFSHDQEETDFAAAQTASMESYQRERDDHDGYDHNTRPLQRPRRVRPLPTDWPSILKEPEVAQVGQRMCIVCYEHCPTICFQPCHHQVMCDGCVRKMWEMPIVGDRKCPVCQDVPEGITRPVLSEYLKE